MKKQLLNLFSYSYLASIIICMFYGTIKAQCPSVSLPYSESFSSVSLGASCSWTNSSASSGAGWSVDPTAYAGGVSPEIQAYGNNACAGCIETVSLTMASPLNTATVTSLQLSFKYKLYVTNQATSGPGTGTLKMQTSANGTTWTDRWTYGYTISGTSLTSIASGTIAVPVFNPSSNDTYMRFTITGVMFKVWGWQIDDVNATSPIATNIESLDQDIVIPTLYPNPTNSLLTINSAYELQKVEVINIAGQVLLSEKANEKSHQLHLQNFAEGIYFVKVVYNNGMCVTKKVVKQ